MAKPSEREVSKYRKRPVVIEAVRYDGHNHEEIGAFAGENVSLEGGILFVRTLENRRLEADRGDWIIKGIKGEFYPCKPDIFAATYEPATQTSAPEAVEEAISRIRVHFKDRGLCKLLSLGDNCNCPLCDLDRIATALARRTGG